MSRVFWGLEPQSSRASHPALLLTPVRPVTEFLRGETHYLDHPLFGVVVRLEPLEPEALKNLGEELADPAWAGRHGRADAAPRPDDAP